MSEDKSPEQVAYELALRSRLQAQDARLRRSHLLRLYLPVGLMSLLILGLSIVLIWLTQAPAAERSRDWVSFASAGADLIIIVTLLPLMVLCALLPAGVVALYYFKQRRGWSVNQSVRNFIRRGDGLLFRGQSQVKRGAPIAVKQVATLRGSLAYGRSIVKNLIAWIIPKKENNERNN
ncbi:MAG: hypothetical protein AAF633_10200 [Chloroflexota bacterium]